MGTLDSYLLHNRHFKKETRVRCLLLWQVNMTDFYTEDNMLQL